MPLPLQSARIRMWTRESARHQAQRAGLCFPLLPSVSRQHPRTTPGEDDLLQLVAERRHHVTSFVGLQPEPVPEVLRPGRTVHGKVASANLSKCFSGVTLLRVTNP